MAKFTQFFECEHCGKTYKTENGCVKHELVCESNPINDVEGQFRKALDEEAEQIRLTATSPEHLIQMTKAFLLKYGIKVSFTSYPSTFDTHIRNSHNSPINLPTNWSGDPSAPSYYPGFRGYWNGTIEVIDQKPLGLKNKHIYFSNLNDSWRDHKICLPWLNTGSGGGGGGIFRYDGIIWLDDFPKMKEEYWSSNKEFTKDCENFADSIQSYHDQFVKERNNYVQNDLETLRLKKLKRELDDAVIKLSKYTEQHEHNLVQTFNEENGYDLPLPPSAFYSFNSKIMQMHGDLSHGAKHPLDGYEKTMKYLDDLKTKILDYVDTNPEEFI